MRLCASERDHINLDCILMKNKLDITQQKTTLEIFGHIHNFNFFNIFIRLHTIVVKITEKISAVMYGI